MDGDEFECYASAVGEQCRYVFLMRLASELRFLGIESIFLHIHDDLEELKLDDCDVVVASSLMMPEYYEDRGKLGDFCAYKPKGSSYPPHILTELRSYLDSHRGALVILADAGGLCPRGPDESRWRADGYEPMSVGCYAVRDPNSFVDDSAQLDCLTSAKMCAGGNPRFFAGVEHIRGPEIQVAWGEPVAYDTDDKADAFDLSNYPSKLIPGAIVHARWLGKPPEDDKDDCLERTVRKSRPRKPPVLDVPFIVENPRWPVLSVFFGGDADMFLGGDYGHNGVNADDRLQLMANCVCAMILKGKELNRIE